MDDEKGAFLENSIDEYIEKAALLLNKRKSGLLTRDEFMKESNSLSFEYGPKIKEAISVDNWCPVVMSVVERIKKRAKELRSV